MIPHPAVVSVLKGIAPIFPLWKIVPTGDILTQAFKVPEKRVIVSVYRFCFVHKELNFLLFVPLFFFILF